MIRTCSVRFGSYRIRSNIGLSLDWIGLGLDIAQVKVILKNSDWSLDKLGDGAACNSIFCDRWIKW